MTVDHQKQIFHRLMTEQDDCRIVVKIEAAIPSTAAWEPFGFPVFGFGPPLKAVVGCDILQNLAA